MITWCIQAPESVDLIQDNLVYQLEPPAVSDQPSLHEWFAEPQRQAILGYLSWYRERLEAEYVALGMDSPREVYRALKYWSGDKAMRSAHDPA